MKAQDIVRALERYRYEEASEDELQRAVASALVIEGIAFDRERSLSRTDRIDFWADRTGIECKTAGSLAEVTRQLFRYAESAEVDALILVTTRLKLARVPRQINGKAVHVVATMGGLL